MMIEQEGNTVDEAIELALKKLGVPKEKVKIEVITEGKKGVFGLGTQLAKVRVSTIEVEEKKTLQEHPQTSQKELPALEFLKEVFKGLKMEVKLQPSIQEDETLLIEIITSESALLIGKEGKNLDALQYLTNIVVNKDISGKRIRILLDVEGYRGRRKESLIKLAKKIADEVRQTGKSVTLEPMSGWERRIVHIALGQDPDITTESKGEANERRVVIKTRKGG